MAHRTVDIVDVLFSETVRRFNGNLKVNVMYCTCVTEKAKGLLPGRTGSGDSLSPLRGEG